MEAAQSGCCRSASGATPAQPGAGQQEIAFIPEVAIDRAECCTAKDQKLFVMKPEAILLVVKRRIGQALD
ncbi:hypothetical protein METH_03415 [Leisingera methylohalidivorans DSM 14336]|uniref:Uncharacterized protein n=1 Tax=Leisingera methylohalidivorans DSM 14336 TaxID=999552 RepID=V9VVT7_9RHOB|nr:hypothetical protein METH_03415 [Leisingera methylohalidivorans DSM 14336]